jgi:ornithine cyclodeaminase
MKSNSPTARFLSCTTAATSSTSRLLSAQSIVQLLNLVGLEPFVAQLIEALHADFLNWPQFDKTARVASHSSVGVIELMPVANQVDYSFKYVNGHPNNGRNQLPTVMAFGVLADVATGKPRLLCDLTLATALRTAAMSALAARYLAKPEAIIMAVIGNGAQSEFQALAFYWHCGIRHLRLFDTDPRATDKLIDNLKRSNLVPEMTFSRCASIREAVSGADIVTTITADKTNATIITSDMLTPGMHINAVGGDCPGKTELSAEVMHAATVFVEYEPQTRIEGELQQMPESFWVTELFQVFNGSAVGRSNPQELTVFDSVGFALEDYSVLRLIEQHAYQLNLGTEINLVPSLVNPKNLFGLLDNTVAQADAPPLELRATLS